MAGRRRGHAEETFVVTAPRHPGAAKAMVATGAPAAVTNGSGNNGVDGGTGGSTVTPPDCPLFLAQELELPGLPAL